VLGALAAQCADRRVGVVTHEGVIRALLPRLRLANGEWRAVEARKLLVGSEGDA
jgi:broad specificity phosphatase PhoE